MPLDGANNYFYPPGTRGIPDHTIESEAYNTFLDDLTMNDLNVARPVHRGGTGATTAETGLTNLGGEHAYQTVTNYDTHVFKPGSFNSAIAVPGAPNAINAFVGICYMSGASTINLEARAQSNPALGTGKKYVRQKAGTWGPWRLDDRTISSTYEGISGDTADMFFGLVGTAPTSYFVVNTESDPATGVNTLSVPKSGGTVYVNGGPAQGAGIALVSNSVTDGTAIAAKINGTNRWGIRLGDGTAETGSNAGSNFRIDRYGTPGDTLLGSALQIERANGSVYFERNITVPGDVFVTGTHPSGSGNITCEGHVHVDYTNSDAYIYFGSSGAQFYYDGSSFRTNIGDLYLPANVRVAVTGYKPGGGSWAATSDVRVKNELGNYTRGLAEIAQLRPVYYTYKGNDTDKAPAGSTLPYPESPNNIAATEATRYAGLIAQEVEAIFPEMVTQREGFIDGQPAADVRDLDTSPLIFALINAVKELKAEIEQLKATR